MIEQIYTYFSIETLYMWINIGVLPFWFILIFFPHSHLARIFVASIFPIFVLSGVYIFVLYKSYLIGYDFIGCLLYTSQSPRDGLLSRMPSSA